MDENNMSPIPKKKRRKWLRIVVYIALPVFGMVIGSGVTMSIMRSAMRRAFTMSTDELAYKVTSGIAFRYDLDPGQRSRVHSIATTHIGNMMQIRDEVRPRINSEMQAFRDEVGEVLGVDQRGRWDGNFGWMFSRGSFPTPVLRNDRFMED